MGLYVKWDIIELKLFIKARSCQMQLNLPQHILLMQIRLPSAFEIVQDTMHAPVDSAGIYVT